MEESSDKYCFQKSYALEYMILDCNFNKKQIKKKHCIKCLPKKPSFFFETGTPDTP